MAGAILGIIGGAALGYEGGKIRQQHEQKSQFANLIVQQSANNPGLLDMPESQKVLKDVYGKDGVEILKASVTAHKQSMASLPQAPGTASQGPSAPNQPQLNHGIPGMSPDDPKAWSQYIDNLEQHRRTNPELSPVIDHEQGLAKERIENLQKQQEFDQTKAQQQQFHEDTQASREASRQLQEQEHADSLSMRAEGLAQSADMHRFMMQMAVEKEGDAKQQHFQSATQNLATRTANIGKLLSATTPADPATVKTLLDQRNADAKMLAAEAKKAGIDYDEEQFKPLTVKSVPGWLASHTGGMIGGNSSSLAPADSGAAPANVDDFVKKYGGK